MAEPHSSLGDEPPVAPRPTGFRSVLVCLDRSRAAEAALPLATHLAKADGASVILFHVLEPAGRGRGSRDPATRHRCLRGRAMASALERDPLPPRSDEPGTARELAEAQREIRRTGAAFLDRGDLDALDAAIARHRTRLRARPRDNPSLRIATEWLLDNDYLVRGVFTQLRHELPASFQRRLPRLAGDGRVRAPWWSPARSSACAGDTGRSRSSPASHVHGMVSMPGSEQDSSPCT
ncbi:MAG TPA: universal stress protein [Kofleriaceae bacterium]